VFRPFNIAACAIAAVGLTATTVAAQATPRPIPLGNERIGSSLQEVQATHIRNVTIKPPGPPTSPPPGPYLNKAAFQIIHHH
jgi:hypothetical protein